MLRKIYSNNLFYHALFLRDYIFRMGHVPVFLGRNIRSVFHRVRICVHICFHIYVLGVFHKCYCNNRHEECYKEIRQLLDIDCTSLIPRTFRIRTLCQVCAQTLQTI